MSLYGALFSGVSGLSAQSSAMGAISDNISNVNTVGYKGTKVNFQTLITKQVSLTKYSPGGAQSTPRQGVDVQGLLQATSSATDLGMSGSGFFVVNSVADPGTSTGGVYGYTRAGSFKPDKSGYLQNSAGFYLQGWPLMRSDGSVQARASEITLEGVTYMRAYKDNAGLTHYCNPNIVSDTELRAMNVNTIGGTATATKHVRMGANLPAGDTIGQQHKTSVLLYDSLGNTNNVNYTWTKQAANQWSLSAVPPAGAATLTLRNATGSMIYGAGGRIDFSSVPPTAAPNNQITIDTQVYTFVAGVPAAANQVSVDSPTAADPTAIAQRLVQAMNLTRNGALGANAAGASTAAGDVIRITYNGGTTQDINVPSMNLEGVVSAINAYTSTTGVVAVNVSGKLAFYNQNPANNATVANQVGTPLSAAGAMNMGAASFVLPANPYTDRYVANGNSIEITQNTTGGAISVTIPSTATWTPQAQVDLGLPTQGVFNLPAGASLTTNPAITFDGSGIPTAIGPTSMDVKWTNGSTNMAPGQTVGGAVVDTSVDLFFGNVNQPDGMTQYAGSYEVNYLTQDGARFGNFAGLSISDEGIVTALFDNGVRRPVFQIPIATFVNPNGLEGMTGNTWIETDQSGQYTLRQPGEAGSGKVASASLEASTVDLGEEFTTMITTQRAYSAAAKIITTSDQMLDELVNIKR